MKLRKVFSFALVVAMLLMQTAMITGAEEANELIWNFDAENGELYVEGMGEMPDYKAEIAPWKNFAPEIRRIIIRGDLTTVGTYAFQNCTNVSLVDIEANHIERIEFAAFRGCSQLRTLCLPASLKQIAASAFYGCSEISEIIFRGTEEEWHSINFGDNLKYLETAEIRFEDMPSDTEYDYTSIEFNARTDYDYGEDFYCEVYGSDIYGNRCEIPLELCIIEGYDKYLADSEQEVTISYGGYSHVVMVHVYGNGEGEPDEPLPENNISWTINENGVLTVYGEGEIPDYEEELPPWEEFKYDVRAIVITGNIIAIGSSAFENCHETDYVCIDSDVEVIRTGAFENCHKIQEVYLPASVMIIEEGAFMHCDEIRGIHYRGTEDEWLSVHCFDEYMIDAVVEYECGCTPDSGENEEKPYTEVTFDNAQIEYDKGENFYIEVYAYENDGERVQIPLEECTIEGFDSFTSGIQTVTVYYNEFSYSIDVSVCDGDNFTWSYNPLTKELYYYKAGEMADFGNYAGIKSPAPWKEYCGEAETITIGDKVTSITDGAFAYCYELKKIEFGSSLTTIEGFAFERSPLISSLSFPDSLTTIGANAFRGCTGLSDVTFGANLTTLGSAAFAGCENLTSITLPEGITQIEPQTFVTCDGLVEIYLPSTLTEINAAAFTMCDGLTDIYYDGTINQWSQITIEFGNECLTEANIHCIDGDVPKVEESEVKIVFENVKTEYEYGEEFYVEVYEITDGVTKEVYDYTVEGFNSRLPGKQTVTVSYGEYTESFIITVYESAVAEPENGPVVTVSGGECMPGETIDVVVSLRGNTGFSNLGLEIDYSEELELIAVAENSDVDAMFTPSQDFGVYPYNINFDNANNSYYNGDLVTLTFRVKDDALRGEYYVNVDFYKGRDGSYIDGEDVNYDENENPLNLSYEGGTVTVYTRIAGDIDGNGMVNNRDATYLLRYLAGWDMEEIDAEALDTTGDGRITSKDGTRLLRYLAGWEVEIY